ncbi:MAG: hypothetical protein KatS3mg083_145 [Candidatus Dojkabacteria bacterium]|nr:MAG: hypothetical protein KatS3mg083_145 [Candidatus Dojkabacteria bacterium]
MSTEKIKIGEVIKLFPRKTLPNTWDHLVDMVNSYDFIHYMYSKANSLDENNIYSILASYLQLDTAGCKPTDIATLELALLERKLREYFSVEKYDLKNFISNMSYASAAGATKCAKDLASRSGSTMTIEILEAGRIGIPRYFVVSYPPESFPPEDFITRIIRCGLIHAPYGNLYGAKYSLAAGLLFILHDLGVLIVVKSF